MKGSDFAQMFRGYLVATAKELASLPEEDEKREWLPKVRACSEEAEVFPLHLRYGRFDRQSTPQDAEELAAQGKPNYAIAEALRIDECTLAAWCNLYPSLRHAIDRGREEFRRTMPAPRRPRCPRCDGWIDVALEFVKESSMARRIPRCLICGKRYYRTTTVI